LEKELYNLKKRVEKHGIAFTTPSIVTRNLSKKTSNVVVFKNRRLKQSVVINDKKLKELLGTDYL